MAAKPIPILWDAENASLPGTAQPEQVLGSIANALTPLGIHDPVMLRVVVGQRRCLRQDLDQFLVLIKVTYLITSKIIGFMLENLRNQKKEEVHCK